MINSDMEIEKDRVLDPYTKEPAQYLFSAIDNRGRPGTFKYYKGSNQFIFLDPVPENLGDYYEEGYQPIPETEADLAEMAKGDAYRLETVQEFVSKGDFLEIGPWIGLVSYSAKQAGYNVSTLEMTPECVELMQRVGIDAVQTSEPAATLAESGKSYDVIGLWHSIEHIPDPQRMIETAARAVRPGGILLIATPNPDSAQFRLLKNKWWGLDAPRHLHLAPMSFYEKIGRANGLKVVHRTTDDELARQLNKIGWNWELQRQVRGTIGLRSLVRLPLWRVFEKLYRKPGTFDGSAYTLVMQRPFG